MPPSAADALQRLLEAWDGDHLDGLLPAGSLSVAKLDTLREQLAERLWAGDVGQGQLALVPLHYEARWELCDAADPTRRHQGLALLAAIDLFARFLGTEDTLELVKNV